MYVCMYVCMVNGIVLERGIGRNLERGRLVSIWNAGLPADVCVLLVYFLLLVVCFLLVFFFLW